MKELKKILEEIEQLVNMHYEDDSVETIILRNLRDIRKHMSGKDTGVPTNNGWIPVDDRLPKTNGTYNVTRHIDGHFISDSAYFDGQNTWHSDNRVNHSRPYLTDVIAWRPLPEPYCPKKESEGSRRLREREEFFKGVMR